MNFYNVTYPYGKEGIITVKTILAANGFDAQKQLQTRTRKGVKKVFGMKGVKVSISTDEEVQEYLAILESMESGELEQAKKAYARRVG